MRNVATFRREAATQTQVVVDVANSPSFEDWLAP
jgi:hypothetical protein